MTDAKADVYLYWRKALAGEVRQDLMLPTSAATVGADGAPQPGLWKINVGGGYDNGVKRPKKFVPMQIWLQNTEGQVIHKWQEGLVVTGTIDDEPVTSDRIEQRWLGAVALTKADREHYVKNGRWPEDPPEPVGLPVRDTIDLETIETTTMRLDGNARPVAHGKTGHNSGDLSTFQAMREQIKGEIAEAKIFFTKNPIKTKADADKCENWRQRIYNLMKKADEQRIAEKRPHDEAAAAVQALWKPLVDEAKAGAASLQETVDIWDRSETDRRRKEAEEEARARLEAEHKAQAEARAAALKKREAEEAILAQIAADNPVLATELPELTELPPEPDPIPETILVEVPKVMYGTTGTRRSTKAAAATATVVDIKAAAAFYAEQKHPDLIALIQKLADKACKVRGSVPGVYMSWQQSEAVE